MKSLKKHKGVMLVLSSPSGAGKSSICRALLDLDRNLYLSISTTTRKKRPNEVSGIDYNFVTLDEFEYKLSQNNFIEHAKVFNNFYGTDKSIVENKINEGKDLLFDIDWQGAQQLREKMREDIVSVFILPPSKKELERRLKERGQDTDEVVKERMSEATAEITHWAEYDYVIINEDLNLSVKTVLGILHSERMKRIRQIGLGEFVRSISLDN
ncbi:MAG: guanylate kinase [Alphaproteobacteria bacterium]|jgi:guanylate kinase|nr:guanylate kinase [Alphaproteobacteria bacterium]|tara:strand:- start:635 stop:1270 length:636 start_codon:yes stop_codon:yes gene_type:complete